jgi:hypothetical protein
MAAFLVDGYDSVTSSDHVLVPTGKPVPLKGKWVLKKTLDLNDGQRRLFDPDVAKKEIQAKGYLVLNFKTLFDELG